jgi:hypothetical protein
LPLFSSSAQFQTDLPILQDFLLTDLVSAHMERF